MSGAVHLTVDLDRCIGIGQCEMLEPEVFRLDDEDGISRVADGATLDRARAAEVPAYAIFKDATLADLLNRWPDSPQDLLEVSGIGPVKADRFGADLLAILAGHERPESAAPPPAPPRAKAPPVDHGALDLELLEALRAWRLEHSDGKPAYTVFTNATMHELAASGPTTPDELLAVSGIGPAKVERFGAELLAFLADWA